MKAYRKNRTPEMLFGCGTSKKTGEDLKNQCISNCLVVTDKGIKSTGIVDPIIKSIEDAQVKVTVFDDVKPEAPDTVCLNLANMVMENNYDGIVAIGGGSVMDTAKAAAMIPALPQPVKDLHEYGGTGTLMKNSYVRNIKLVAIPTTSGTGAESTASAVVFDTKRNLKYSFMNPSMSPDLAIIDPMLTIGMPPKPSAIVGLDVLCHATENLLGAQQNDFTDPIMVACIKRVWEWLPIVFKEPGNVEARSQMSWAASNALANGGVPNGHAIGHAIGATYGIVHAHACVLVLPSVIRHQAAAYPDKIKQLAEIVGVPTEEDTKTIANRVAKKYVAFYKQFGLGNLQETLKAAGKLDDEDTFVKKIIPLTLDDFKSRLWNPSIHRPEDHERLVSLLQKIYEEK